MKEDDGTVGSGGKGAEELIAGEGDSLGVVVLVGDGFDSNVPEDREVVHWKKKTHQARLTLRGVNSNTPHVGSGT